MSGEEEDETTLGFKQGPFRDKIRKEEDRASVRCTNDEEMPLKDRTSKQASRQALTQHFLPLQQTERRLVRATRTVPFCGATFATAVILLYR